MLCMPLGIAKYGVPMSFGVLDDAEYSTVIGRTHDPTSDNDTRLALRLVAQFAVGVAGYLVAYAAALEPYSMAHNAAGAGDGA